MKQTKQELLENILDTLDTAETQKWFDMPDTPKNWRVWKRIRNEIRDKVLRGASMNHNLEQTKKDFERRHPNFNWTASDTKEIEKLLKQAEAKGRREAVEEFLKLPTHINEHGNSDVKYYDGESLDKLARSLLSTTNEEG